MRLAILLTVVAVAASGCATSGMGSDTFDCGEGKEVRCASVMEALRRSEAGGQRAGTQKAVDQPPVTIPAMGATIDDSKWPKPILEPARVLRIWVAPWRDANDTLHWPSYMFTEVQTRKWSMGQPDFRGVKPLVPLQVQRRPPVGETSKQSNQ